MEDGCSDASPVSQDGQIDVETNFLRANTEMNRRNSLFGGGSTPLRVLNVRRVSGLSSASFTTRVPCGGGGCTSVQQHQHIWVTERIHHQGERSHARSRPPQTCSRWNDPPPAEREQPTPHAALLPGGVAEPPRMTERQRRQRTRSGVT